MQASQWTTDIIIITALLSFGGALLAYLFTNLRNSQKISQLQAELEQAQQAYSDAESARTALNAQLKDAEEHNHQLQLAENTLQTQLQSATENQARLRQEQQEAKDRCAALEVRIEQTARQHHEAVTQHETAQADIRGLKASIDDYKTRLEQAQNALQQEREKVEVLNQNLAEEGKKAEGLSQKLDEAREHFAEQRNNLKELKVKNDGLQEQLHKLSNEHTELKTTLQKREEHFQQQMQQLGETKQSLTKEFENLANKIFEEKGKTFTQSSQAGIDSLLKPFREQIEGFQKRINEVHDASLQGNTTLNSEIKKVLEIGLQMSKEANNLTSALKGDSQQRGAWGEAQLRRTLEMSGLVEEAHYEVQSSFKDQEGKQKQTDYLIKLPDGKHIIIDSKVALNAYDRAVGAESPEAYQLAMADHVKAVRKHIDDLASKDYTNLVGMRSPSFVLMFMPIEPAYIEALKSNKDLFEYGYKKGIVLVSHTTLIPILRTVSNLWMIERSNAEALEISEKAGDIYNQVCLVAERLSKLGGTLNTVSNHYNNTVKALVGQQGLYGKVERFSQLSAKVSKSLPHLEATHVDFETERLALIVEPIEEQSSEPEPEYLDSDVQSAPTIESETAENH